jgi:hypothetical protein
MANSIGARCETWRSGPHRADGTRPVVSRSRAVTGRTTSRAPTTFEKASREQMALPGLEPGAGSTATDFESSRLPISTEGFCQYSGAPPTRTVEPSPKARSRGRAWRGRSGSARYCWEAGARWKRASGTGSPTTWGAARRGSWTALGWNSAAATGNTCLIRARGPVRYLPVEHALGGQPGPNAPSRYIIAPDSPDASDDVARQPTGSGNER